MFSQPPFQNLIRETVKKFSIPVDICNIRRIAIEAVSVFKMDATTRHRVNYFAINVRYCTGDRNMLTSTLVVKDTKAKYDSNFLQMLIEKVLKHFNIGKDNIISIAADNASNMIKIIENSMKVGKKGKMIILL